MQNAFNYSDMLGYYSNAVELGLRTGKVMQNAMERALREHLHFVELTVGQMTPMTKVEQPKDFVAAQSQMLETFRDSFTTTTKNLIQIQQDAGAEIKALFSESAEKFAPESITKLFKVA
jgi:hypothetical protein